MFSSVRVFLPVVNVFGQLHFILCIIRRWLLQILEAVLLSVNGNNNKLDLHHAQQAACVTL